MKKNSFNFIYLFEAVFLLALMFYFGINFVQHSAKEKIINYSSQTSNEFKEISQDYLRTDLQNIDFKKYFDNEAEQMIQNQKNTYVFLETCLTAAMNEKTSVRKQFYFDWAFNVFTSIPKEYLNTPALSLVQAKIAYLQNLKDQLHTDNSSIILKLESIPIENTFYSQAQIWKLRLLSVEQGIQNTQSQWQQLGHNPQFKYKDVFQKCFLNVSELGCL